MSDEYKNQEQLANWIIDITDAYRIEWNDAGSRNSMRYFGVYRNGKTEVMISVTDAGSRYSDGESHWECSIGIQLDPNKWDESHGYYDVLMPKYVRLVRIAILRYFDRMKEMEKQAAECLKVLVETADRRSQTAVQEAEASEKKDTCFSKCRCAV